MSKTYLYTYWNVSVEILNLSLLFLETSNFMVFICQNVNSEVYDVLKCYLTFITYTIKYDLFDATKYEITNELIIC